MNKKYPVLTLEQREVLIGTSLGDAHLKTQTGGNTFSLHIEQSIKKEAYVHHLYDLFSTLVNPQTPPVEQIKEKGVTLSFTTLAHPSLRYYGHLFYSSAILATTDSEGRPSKKRVPKNIHKYLSDRALAYWYMDDGALKGSNRSGKELHTEGFTLEDVQILRDALIYNGIETTVQKQNRVYQGVRRTCHKLYITAKGDSIFTEKIRPFIHPFFEYKMGTYKCSK
jgi:hypothetical protein